MPPIHGFWATRFLACAVSIGRFVRRISEGWNRICRHFTSQHDEPLANPCCCRPDYPRFGILGRKHRRLLPQRHPGPKLKKKVIRIDDSDLMRVDMPGTGF